MPHGGRGGTKRERRMHYVVEIKRRESIGEWVVTDVEEKMAKLKTSRTRIRRPRARL